MKRPETDKELRDLIVETLANHKEHYIIGSWEAFAKKRARKRRLLFLFSVTGIAATFLAGWLGFSFFFESGTEPGSLSALPAEPGKNSVTSSEVQKSNSSNPAPFIQPSSGEIKVLSLNADSAVRSENDKIAETKISEAFQRRTEAIVPLEGKSYNKSVDLNYSLKNSGNTVKDVLYANDVEAPVDNINTDNSLHQRRLRFGVTVAPGMTSTSTASSYNYSGGLNAELLITGNISVSAGIQIEHQNVVNKITDNPSWLPEGKDEALLTALEMPISVTWEFNEKRNSSFYLSGGVSSLAWIGEKYTNTFYTQELVQEVRNTSGEVNVSYVLENVENKAVSTVDPLSTFSLAGRLNLMAGYRKRINDKMSVHFGPFIKIPVSEQATERLRYSVSGISCRLSF
jgi:hypothetical protein